jgi:hypothetical protein
VVHNTATLEVSAVVRLLHAKNFNSAEVHHEICASVYSQNVINEGPVRKWWIVFKMGEEIFRMKSEVVGHLL